MDIKNTIDNNAWNSAITYPVIYIVVASLPAILAYSFQLDEGIVKNILSVVFFTIFLTPAWVIIGLVISKNRLPYLISFIVGVPIAYLVLYFLLPESLCKFLVDLRAYLISF